MRSFQNVFSYLLIKSRSLGQRRLILILSFVVGVLSGLAAVLLKNTVHFLHDFIQDLVSQGSYNLLYLALPGMGIIITVMYVRYFVKDNIGHGVTKILYSISKRGSKIKRHNTYSSMVASTITIGFGGSVGAEAPIVMTGSAIGSNVGQFFRLNYRTLTLLVGCGAAGAIASIFKAPLAGLVFTLEVLLLDLTMSSIVPLLISSVSAASVSYFILGKGVVFDYQVTHPFYLHNIIWYIILGVFCGLVSVYFTRMLMKVEGRYAKITNPYKKWIIGSLMLGILIFIFPPLYGEGYDTLQLLLDGRSSELFINSPFATFQNEYWLLLAALIVLLATKVVATATTTGAGGVGGIFAPTLFMGGVAGYFVAKIINQFVFFQVSESNFVLVGMAGMMAGVMHAPLTAIFLIAEITGGYALFIPLMIASTISFITILYFEPHSIYTKRLAARGELLTHHKDKAVLTLLQLEDLIEKDFTSVDPNDSLGALVKAISQSKRNIFPVVDENKKFVGIVLLNEIRDIMFNVDMYDNTFVRDYISLPPEYININDSMNEVMRKFEDSDSWNLPVLDNGGYIGFVSKSKIFSAYRNVLVQFSE
ncbi:MAG: chloride channel protein [Bacteroidales bacterium]|nr:MAG: chloride channel protein [Bacteroidales bacterium]